MTIRAIALFSGGLDSSLAAALVKAQGVEVTAFHLVSAYCRCTPQGAVHPDIAAAAEEIGIPLQVEYADEAMTRMVLSPRYGFGKNLNPCIDCRLNTILRANAYREAVGADFLVSGEVLGQRPMSQNRNAIERIDSQTGLADILLRPLSAAFFPPTKPEREGWVERNAFPAIQGRTRTEQLALARRFGLTRYGSPAGGCLLTDALYCQRLRKYLSRKSLTPGERRRAEPETAAAAALVPRGDLLLLRTGRHFFTSDGGWVVTGRAHEENLVIQELAEPGDLLLQATPLRGSLVMLRGGAEAGEDSVVFRTAAGLAIHYSKYRPERAGTVLVCRGTEAEETGRRVEAEVVEPEGIATDA